MAQLKLNLTKILTQRCDLLAIDRASVNGHGRAKGTPSLTDEAWAVDRPCRLLPIKGPKEFKDGKLLSISTFNLYIMPVTGQGGEEITEHTWIRLGGKLYDVIEAPPVAIDGAPMELTVEQVNP